MPDTKSPTLADALAASPLTPPQAFSVCFLDMHSDAIGDDHAFVEDELVVRIRQFAKSLEITRKVVLNDPFRILNTSKVRVVVYDPMGQELFKILYEVEPVRDEGGIHQIEEICLADNNNKCELNLVIPFDIKSSRIIPKINSEVL